MLIIDDFDVLLESTAQVLGIEKHLILGPSRHALPSHGRQIVMALWSEHHSLIDSARVVGRISHGVAMYARQRIFSRSYGGDGSVRQQVADVINLYRQKKARPSQYLNINFFAELHGILSPLNPQTETISNQ